MTSAVLALQASGLNKHFGALHVTQDVSLTLPSGTRTALIGAPVYMLLKHFSSQWNPSSWMLIIGVLLIAVVLFGRGGLLGMLQAAARKLRPGERA